VIWPRSASSAARASTRSWRMSARSRSTRLRRAVGQLLPGRGGRPLGGLPAAPRPAAHDPAARRPVPGKRLGDARVGRQGGHQPLRRRFAAARGRARRLRRLRPVRGSHARARGHLLRRADRQPRQLSRDLRPDPAGHRDRRHPRTWHPGPRARHRRGDPGPALLHQGRVEVVQRCRLGGHQHDQYPRRTCAASWAWRSSTSA